MSDAFRDSIFYWTFSSTGGDAYFGYTVADTAGLGGLPLGAVIPSPTVSATASTPSPTSWTTP